MTTIDPAALPPVFTQRGGDPDFVRQELDYAIKAQIGRHPRSQQVEIGPSGIRDCSRHIAYDLARVTPVNEGSGWFTTIGTAVHSWLEDAMQAENGDCRNTRYITEATIRVGDVNGRPIVGHCDLYDRTTAGVVDWKIVGTKSLKKYKSEGPSGQYRRQAHLYGRGWHLLGQPVDWVGIYFLPRADQLDRAYFWSEPWDEQIALDALTRLEAIDSLVQAGGPSAAAMLPTANDYCSYCPFFLPGSTELTEACPGHKD